MPELPVLVGPTGSPTVFVSAGSVVLESDVSESSEPVLSEPAVLPPESPEDWEPLPVPDDEPEPEPDPDPEPVPDPELAEGWLTVTDSLVWALPPPDAVALATTVYEPFCSDPVSQVAEQVVAFAHLLSVAPLAVNVMLLIVPDDTLA